MNNLERYYSIVEAVHLAVEAEQLEEGAPFTAETERCLDVVYTLLQEALGVTDPDATPQCMR